ncbi:MAG: ABC transporter ATP-binding protein [Aristaeellaceae bacterium]
MLRAEHIHVQYGHTVIVDDLSFDLQEGQWLMLLGPNGAGKSTLVEAIVQGVPYSGRFVLHGKDIRSFKPAQLAREIGVLSQKNAVGYAYTVEEVVSLGRYAHAGGFLAGRDADREQFVEQALAQAGLTELRHASVLTLSGGELQRVFLAQVFAQNPKVLILDEPSNHLDLVYQKQTFLLLQAWLRQPGRAILSVVHDLSLARTYGTHAVLIHHGACTAQGTMEQVMTPEHLQAVYGMDVYQWMREQLQQWR